ncbi:DUF3467 domain-containing protein [Candidatus Woesearchaeota archaeon]|nr:DUF3467 domain-containing protein [Candidatus Woesearchaeota archaeon]
MTEPKKINLGIQDGQEFFAHELSVHFNPTQFIFDFRSVTPRNDPRSKDVPFISIRHNVVLSEPYHAKRILEVLKNVIEQYEKQFGKIEKPKAVKEYEKKMKNAVKKDSKKSTKETIPSYLG